MKVVNLQEPKNIYVTEREMPVREKGMALLKIKAAGICGSDIGAYRGVNNLVSYPRDGREACRYWSGCRDASEARRKTWRYDREA